MYPTQFIKKLSIISLGVFVSVFNIHGADDVNEMYDELGRLETGGQRAPYRVVTELLGRYQFNMKELEDLGFVDRAGTWICKENIKSRNDFLSKHDVQEKAIRELFLLNKSHFQAVMKNEHEEDVDNLGELSKKYSEFGILSAVRLVGAEAVCATYGDKYIHLGRLLGENGRRAKEYAKKFPKESESGSDSDSEPN